MSEVTVNIPILDPKNRRKIAKSIEEIIENASDILDQKISEKTPVDTGALKESIKGQRVVRFGNKIVRGSVASDRPYARYVEDQKHMFELGTEEANDEIVDFFSEELSEAIGELK